MSRRTTVLVSRTLYQIAAVSLVTSVIWAASGVYQAVRDPVKIEVKPELLEPLTPTIDERVIDQLERRREINRAELEAITALVTRQVREREQNEAEIFEVVASEVATPAAVAEP